MNNLHISDISLLILLWVTLSPSLGESRALFGEPCNETIPCNSEFSLTCKNGFCVCLRETEMYFDFSREKCVVLVGKRCRHNAIVSDDEGNLEWRWAEALDCVENANCNSDGKCECESEFFGNSSGHCVLKKGYDESCDINEECRENDNLICTGVGGKCSCNLTEAVYYEEHGICVGKVGASCEKYSGCVQNAFIPSCGFGDFYDLCQCRSYFRESSDGLCLGTYNEECDPNRSPCVGEFSCINGYCKCHFPKYQVREYESESGMWKCKSVVNGPCKETVNGIEFQYDCIGESECRDDKGLPECLCKKGFIKSDGGTCKKASGNICKSTEECDKVPGTTLICREGRCSCDDLQVYNESMTKCLNLWGAKCDGDQSCIPNAYCQTERHDPESKAGICRCKDGTKVNLKRECIMRHDQDNITDFSEL